MIYRNGDSVGDFIRNNLTLLGFIALFLFGVILIAISINMKTDTGDSGETEYYNENLNYYISLMGDEVITIYKGEEYVEPGYKASDSRGNDLTDQVEVDNEVDINTVGVYVIRYTLKGTVRARKVKVIEKPVGKTKLSLKGNMNIYLNAGSDYVEPGYTALDSIDGNITDEVKVSGTVDKNKVGTYRLTYEVENSTGVKTEVTREIKVIDTDIKVTLDNNNTYTNDGVTINVEVFDSYFDYMLLPNGEKVTSKTYSYKVNSNGNYKFQIYNISGGGKAVNVNVNTINNSKPTGSCSGSYQNGVSTITIKASDDIGIDRYVIDGNAYTSNKITINKEMKEVKVTIYDKANNSTDVSCKLTDKNVYSSFDNISSYKSKPLNNNVAVNYYASSGGSGFTYWSYVPNKITENLPVIIYLPGLGERGNDYTSGAKTAIQNGPIHEVVKHGYSYEAIILHAQVPANGEVYGYLSSYIELLNKVVKEFKANKNKISIIGFSHGCYGVMNIMKNNRKYFSAAVPIGCEPKNRASYFKYTPTWAFAGAGEGVSSFPGFVNQINSMGGSAKFTRPSYHNHNVLTDEYSILRDDNYKVIDWMISQTRK